jgi:hypothetical protein
VHWDESQDGNWLNGRVISCPRCGEAFLRIDHSPFYDCYYLYCDQCPRRVDVSTYDALVLAAVDAHRASGSLSYENVIAEIEPRLTGCECGGAFRDDSPRRCHLCGSALGDEDGWSGIDVWPHDASEEQIAAFCEEFIREDDIWSPASP